MGREWTIRDFDPITDVLVDAHEDEDEVEGDYK